MSAPTRRVLLVEDHHLVRAGLAAVIDGEPDLHVVGQAEHAAGAIALFTELAPDVVVMDLRLPGLKGADAIRALRRAAPDARVLVLSTYDGEEDVHDAFEAGALGYVLKRARADELLAAIRTVAAGGRHLPPELAAKLSERAGRQPLTPREREVLQLIAQGQDNLAIAAQLEISPGTVKIHVRNVFAKLGAFDRTGATAIALRRGLVHLD